MNKVAEIRSGELRELYRELILDHAKSPRHFGRLGKATHAAEGINPLCGDKLKLYLEIENDRIRDAAFEGSGCAISIASASLMTDTVIGLATSEARDWFGNVTRRLTDESGTADAELGRLEALSGVRDFPSRVKCATLAWHALDTAMKNLATPATTE